jgi:cell division protein FtsW
MTTTRPRGKLPPGSRPVRNPVPIRHVVDPTEQDGDTSARRSGGQIAITVAQKVFGAETGNFFLLLGTTLFLLAFGLVMVLSASSVEDGASAGHDFFSSFARQGLYALIGLPLMLIASRMPLGFWRKWAWPAVLGTSFLQLLVFLPGLGFYYQGNRNWIKIGAFTAQPSELVKLALILWVAWILAAKKNLLDDWKHVFLPIAPVAAVAIGLVLAGNDLGTALILGAVVLGCLFYAGVRFRIIAVAIAVVGVVVFIALHVGGSSRGSRITAFLSGCPSSQYATQYCWQPVHGWWGIASGGIFGSGLGESKAKWSWLPNADNDFIFAIIGDELGFIGAVVVLLLFVVLTIAFVRIIRTSTDPFAKIVTSGVMVWLIGQAFVNIAVVLGLLPVLGVPLPLISAGGSSLIASLVAVGVVLSFARHQPVPIMRSEP